MKLEIALEALAALVNCPDYRGINTHEMRHARRVLEQAKERAGATCPTANGKDLERWEALQAQLRAAIGALRDCRTAAQDRTRPPSARLELVRDYSTNILAAYSPHEAEPGPYAPLEVHWRAEITQAIRAAIASQPPGVIGCSVSHLWGTVAHWLHHHGAQVPPERAPSLYREEVARLPFCKFVYPDNKP